MAVIGKFDDIYRLTSIQVTYKDTEYSNIVLEVLSEKGRPSFIPQHKLVVGDIIALKEYDLYSSRLDDDELFWSGFIVKLTKQKITLTVSEVDEQDKQSNLPNIMGICKV